MIRSGKGEESARAICGAPEKSSKNREELREHKRKKKEPYG